MPCILVVEDDLALATVVQDELEVAGYAVLGPVASQAEAVNEALAGRPDLVVMDIGLKSGDGIAAAMEIRASSSIPILFATGDRDPATQARADRARPAGWLGKPYSPEQLLSAVRAALAHAIADVQVRS